LWLLAVAVVEMGHTVVAVVAVVLEQALLLQ